MTNTLLQRYKETYNYLSELLDTNSEEQRTSTLLDYVQEGLAQPEVSDMLFNVLRTSHDMATCNSEVCDNVTRISAMRTFASIIKMGCEALHPKELPNTQVTIQTGTVLNALRSITTS